MRARTLDLRPAKVHGPPRFDGGRSGGILAASLAVDREDHHPVAAHDIMLVALGVGAVVGPPPAAADTAAPHGKAAAGAHQQATAKPPKEPTATQAVCSANMNAKPYSWMADIAPCMRNRRLSDILIPASHDSATYVF